jgi:hypothetical protein
MAVCTTTTTFGPGVITAIPQTDATLTSTDKTLIRSFLSLSALRVERYRRCIFGSAYQLFGQRKDASHAGKNVIKTTIFVKANRHGATKSLMHRETIRTYDGK